MVKYTRMGKDDCIFCKIVKREIPSKVVFEDNKIMVFEDINPKAPVHIVIIPKYHIEKVSDLTTKDIHLIGELVLTAKDIAKTKKIEETGFRIVMNCNKDAGQEIFHLHLHLLGGRKFTWPPG